MSAIFVTGSGTDVGKTYVLAALIEALRSQGRAVEALKPAVSGFDPQDWSSSDCGRLLVALGRPLDQAHLDRLSPYRYRAPLSADAAARAEGQSLALDQLVKACLTAKARAGQDLLLIEGAGGAMSPIAQGATNLDLMTALGDPVLLVGGNYLGTVSHVLTAAEAISGRGLRLLAVVLSETGSTPPVADNAAAAQTFLPGIPVLVATRESRAWTESLLTLLGS